MSDVTLCVTAGGRPDLLRQTLESLLAANAQFFSAIVITNDFGDEATDEVAKSICHHATLIHHPVQQGQLRTSDEAYAHITSEFIFHCEDDWLFESEAFVPACKSLLKRLPNVSGVATRKRDTMDPKLEIKRSEIDGIGYFKVKSPLSWGSFTFNPSLLRRRLWLDHGPYARFGTERFISLHLKRLGASSAYLDPGVSRHSGEGRHLHDPFEAATGEVDTSFLRELREEELRRKRLREATERRNLPARVLQFLRGG
jgi:hypothetical protein